MKAPRRAVALLLMVAAPVLWSTAGVATRHIEAAGRFEIVFWRSLFAAAFVFAAWALATRENPLGAARATGWVGLASGAMWAVMFTAFMLALTLASTANVLVTQSIAPLLTALAARLLLNDPVPLRTWIAALAATAGLGWMFGAGFGARGAGELAGMAVALLVPLAATANVVMLRRSRARVDLVPAVMIGGALSCLAALPLAAPFSASARDLALLALLGCFQLGLPCVLFVMASRSLHAPELALLALLEVVLGPLWAWLGAGEVPAGATLGGGAVVLAALAGNEALALSHRRSRV
jgi:drug/metabolite transporter (DMT)-like permease